ncbi:unnamed protein product [Chondrus crispus]|uniref:Clathrin/coatomer adaptor adaptin-like N-terminal domain-containing protein n=1 Tax=Chondrus crispus TaxID=2769 RepID=R7QRD7_CHOCR|nr:unnamed protein product [Chondrus crispus]CDF40323.1 unnamed protein product [Chondrus crispus]|eukprot:XP_005710617.1 unnamed protein product [Chondrus crispus]
MLHSTVLPRPEQVSLRHPKPPYLPFPAFRSEALRFSSLTRLTTTNVLMAAVSSAASAAAARIGAALSDAQYFESSMVRVEDIRRQLDSRSVKEKLDAMKRVVALISLGKDASTFFPDVVKNVVAPSLDVKKLVYLYLVHYAEEKQDLALLAINSFQKDLSDHNQHIRALSLRVLSSIRVRVILQVVILAISKCGITAQICNLYSTRRRGCLTSARLHVGITGRWTTCVPYRRTTTRGHYRPMDYMCALQADDYTWALQADGLHVCLTGG